MRLLDQTSSLALLAATGLSASHLAAALPSSPSDAELEYQAGPATNRGVFDQLDIAALQARSDDDEYGLAPVRRQLVAARNGTGNANYTQADLDALWANVEKTRPVEYSPINTTRPAPSHIDIPVDPFTLQSEADYYSPTDKTSGLRFPPGFIYGVASAAPQVEGATKDDGKGPNTWDWCAHRVPNCIAENFTLDIADNQYYLYKQDIARIAAMGINAYSFSIAWTRIYPFGNGPVNEKGLEHYDAVIDEVIKAGLTPIVTLFHWDTPLNIELTYGSFRSPEVVNDFATYAKTVFERYGNKVKHWITFNEPNVYCSDYSKTVPLNITNPTGLNDTQSRFHCSYYLLKSHGTAVKIYRDLVASGKIAKGEVGFKNDDSLPIPYRPGNKDDLEVCARHEAFAIGLFAEPVYGSGDWPQIVKDTIPANALPAFTEEDKQLIKGSADFFAIDMYDTRIAKAVENVTIAECAADPNNVAWPVCQDQSDPKYSTTRADGWTLGELADPKAAWLYNSAGWNRGFLKYLHKTYPSPKIYVSEFGFAEPYENNKTELFQITQDNARYFTDSLSEILLAYHEDELPMAGVIAWSLVDNFEWYLGLSLRFGLQYVNYTDTENLPRYYKRSFFAVRDFAKKHLSS